MTDPLLFDLPMSFETERLRMRAPQHGDGAALHAAKVDSIMELRRFLGSLPWAAQEPTVESSELWCRKAHGNFMTRADLPFLVFEKATGDVVGCVGLHRTVWATPRTEVGYWGRTTRAGSGFIGEAVRALCDYAFTHIGAVRIELVTDDENAASIRVAERCGFTLEGTMRHAQRAPDGSLRNLSMYACFPEAKK